MLTTQLLYGPYHPPRLKVGDVTTCLLRDCDVVVTSFTDARIPWPRCRSAERHGMPGLLLAGDLVRAVQCESAAAIRYHWGVSAATVWKWRKAIGVGKLPKPARK